MAGQGPASPAPSPRRDAGRPAPGRLAREAERLRDDLAEADALRREGVLTLRAYAAESARIEARLAEVEALTRARPARRRPQAILGADDVPRAWRESEDLAARRAVLAEAVGTTITVHPKRSGLVEVGWRRM